ncbi:MAG: type II toxin-antitoxin system VapC family toxin [Pseudomonadota bacterium]
MKRLLLDTHTLLWWLSDSPSLGVRSREAIADPRNEVFVSAASIWEISIKRAIGKLDAPDDMDSIVEDEGMLKLPITLFHGEQAGALPEMHKDPFDRLLIAQAQAEGLVVVTAGKVFQQYKIQLIDVNG